MAQTIQDALAKVKSASTSGAQGNTDAAVLTTEPTGTFYTSVGNPTYISIAAID